MKPALTALAVSIGPFLFPIHPTIGSLYAPMTMEDINNIIISNLNILDLWDMFKQGCKYYKVIGHTDARSVHYTRKRLFYAKSLHYIFSSGFAKGI